MENKLISYSPELYQKWRRKLLQKKWQGQYKQIFDNDDLRIALSQPRYHFGEWFVAIYYAKRGYRALVEKYLYRNHPRKLKVISRYFGPREISILKHPKPRHQAPDLFVYRGKKFFFVEVKKDNDRLSKSQGGFFEKIEKKLKCEVLICYLKALKTEH